MSEEAKELLFNSLEEVDTFFEHFLIEEEGVVTYRQYPNFTHCTSGKNEGAYVNSNTELPAGVYWGVILMDFEVRCFFRFGYSTEKFDHIKPFVEKYSKQIVELLGPRAVYYGPKGLKGYTLQDVDDDLHIQFINPVSKAELKDDLLKFYEIFDNLRKWKSGEFVTWFHAFKSIGDVVSFVNKELGDWCDEFGQKRKNFVGLQKAPTRGKLFGDKNINERGWAINEGGHKEIQYHIFLRDGEIGYGLGFSVEYTPYYNEKSNIDYLKPFTDAYWAIKDDVAVSKLKEKGFSFIYEPEEGLSHIEDGKYYCFAKVIGTDIISVSQMIADIKGDLFELYCKVFEAKNNNLCEKRAAMKQLETPTKLLKLKKNIILQGAPGTGKTYNTAALALSILGVSDIDYSDHEAVMKKYNELLIDFDEAGSIKNDGQIGFVTFHQSMDYEDFVEGIKPKTNNGQVTYDIENGIFKSICKKAMPKFNDTVDNFEDVWKKLVDELDEKEKIPVPLLKGTSTFDIELNEYGDGLATRTYLDGKDDWERGLSKFFSKDQLYRVYQDLPGIPSGGHDNYRKAIIKELKKNYGLLEFKKGTQEGSSPKNYVLIIDEINRGNVSKIFGELISLLEADKRIGGDHPLTVTLPYSKESFSVPSNLYIIGTMNTTDRSVGSIDYAVRRRFAFVTLEADENKVPEGNARNLFNAVKNFLNKSKYDMDIEDLMVGHSYFMDANNLQMKWQYEILPLLMEYHKDGIISKSPLKDDSGNEIADVKKDYAKFVEAWQKKESDSPN